MDFALSVHIKRKRHKISTFGIVEYKLFELQKHYISKFSISDYMSEKLIV